MAGKSRAGVLKLISIPQNTKKCPARFRKGRAVIHTQMKDLIQFKPKGDIQFDGEIAAGIENPVPTGHQVLRRVFQATQVILPGLISDIGNTKM